jgi:hypothetical protein
MIPNKSILYILPLIEGWSADADFPLNCYAKIGIPNSVILEYKTEKDNRFHQYGILMKQVVDRTYLLYSIKYEYINDYKLLMSGRYSQVSDECKTILLSRAPTTKSFQEMEKILYKNKEVKRKLEKFFMVNDIDSLVDEYESKFGNEETLNL